MSGFIKKNKKEKPFSMIYNDVLRDRKLSWQAKGLYAYLASNSDEWSIKKTGLTTMSTNGYSSMNSAFNELVSKRYIIEVGYNRENGRFQGVNYEFNEIAPNGDFQQSVESPNGDFPQSVFPQSENQQLIKNNTITSNSNKEQNNNNLNLITEKNSVGVPIDLFSGEEEEDVKTPVEKKEKKVPAKKLKKEVHPSHVPIKKYWFEEFNKGAKFSIGDGEHINRIIENIQSLFLSRNQISDSETITNFFKMICVEKKKVNSNFIANSGLSVLGGNDGFMSIINSIDKNGKEQTNNGTTGNSDSRLRQAVNMFADF